MDISRSPGRTGKLDPAEIFLVGNRKINYGVLGN
jgi:hypothetical protein